MTQSTHFAPRALVAVFYIILVVFLHEKGAAVTNLLTSPPIVYVHEDGGVVHIDCFNGSDDGTYHNNILNAWWYRQYSDGSLYRITASGPPAVIFSQGHVLTFYPRVRRVDQGQYFCCLPGRSLGEGDCSKLINVSIAVAADIEVTRTNYTGYVGYSVTLLCRIVNTGTPPATFGWIGHGRKLPSNLITNNGTHVALTFSNVTKSDEGVYYCTVDGVSTLKQYPAYLHVQAPPKISVVGPRIALVGKTVQLTCSVVEGSLSGLHIITPLGQTIQGSQYNFTISLSDTGHYQCVGKLDTSDIIVTESHYLYVYDINNRTSVISFLVFVDDDYCRYVETHGFETLLFNALTKSISKLCNCDISVTSKRFQCAGEHKAYFDITVEGFMAGNIKEFLENNQLIPKFDLGFATLYVCDGGHCLYPTTTTTTPTNTATAASYNVTNDVTIIPQDDSGSSSDSHKVSIIAIILSLSVLTIVVICLVVALVLSRWMCSNKGGSCTMCNCVMNGPPSPMRSDIQFLCNESNTTNKDNLSVPTVLHITNSISAYPDEQNSLPSTTMNTTCEPKEAKHDSRQSNFPVADGNRELIILTASSVINHQGPQSFTSSSADHINQHVDQGMSEYMEDHTQVSYGVECTDTKNVCKQIQTGNHVQEIQTEDSADLPTPAGQQNSVNTVLQQHCETCV